MEIERTELPGIGLQHVFTTRSGRRMGVIAHRNGRRNLIAYDATDPDTAAEDIPLTAEEADGLSELLAATRIVERLSDLERQVEGLVTEQITVVSGSPYDGRTLGATQTRSRTGASIVAVVREGEVVASPGPDFLFRAGDMVMAVGTAEGTAAMSAIFTDG